MAATSAQLRALKKARAARKRNLAAKRKKNPAGRSFSQSRSRFTTDDGYQAARKRKRAAIKKRTPAAKRGTKRAAPKSRMISRSRAATVLRPNRTPRRANPCRRKNPVRMYFGVAIKGKRLYYFTGAGFTADRRSAAMYHTDAQAARVMKTHLSKLAASVRGGYRFGTAHSEETRNAIIATLS